MTFQDIKSKLELGQKIRRAGWDTISFLYKDSARNTIQCNKDGTMQIIENYDGSIFNWNLFDQQQTDWDLV